MTPDGPCDLASNMKDIPVETAPGVLRLVFGGAAQERRQKNHIRVSLGACSGKGRSLKHTGIITDVFYEALKGSQGILRILDGTASKTMRGCNMWR